MDTRSIQELFSKAIRRFQADGESQSTALCALQGRGTQEVFDAAIAICGSTECLEREIGALVLGQLGSPERTFPNVACEHLLRLAADEADLNVLRTMIFAIGHTGSRCGDAELVKFADHPDDQVRHGVAFSLVGTTEVVAVEALLVLMQDRVSEVRDWATTAIGTSPELDGYAIRDALFARTRDVDAMTRGEAYTGLAKRGAEELVQPLLAELKALVSDCDGAGLNHYFLEAAKIYLGLEDEVEFSTEELMSALERKSFQMRDRRR
jgi:HEAT repeat protein